MLEVRRVCVRLGGKVILHGVDLELAPGELVSVIGPNGSGKTTLVRALTGEVRAEGEIRLLGRRLSELRPRELAERRAVLPQASLLSFPFTVREVVRLGVSSGYPGVPLDALEGLPERALERVDLAGFAGRFFQELSGGEQQRVQLARVLCQVWKPVVEGKPRCLLLDEPVSNLDVHHQLAIMRLARDFADRGGAVLAVMHDLNLAAMFSDRLIAMQNGRAAAVGPVKEVLTDELLRDVFGCALAVGVAPKDVPFVLPQSVRD